MRDTTITHADGTITPQALANYSARRPSRTREHPILGSEGSDFTLRPAGLRVGQFTLAFPAGPEGTAAAAALAVPQAFTLTSASRPDVNMVFLLADGDAPEVSFGVAGEVLVTIQFRETAP